MAKLIHEMSCYAHHSHDVFGQPLHGYFLHHPMLKSHRAPTNTTLSFVHNFWISDGQQGLAVMVNDGVDGVPWISIAPDGDFDGCHVQSGSKFRYMVSVDPPLTRPQGQLARKLLRKMVWSTSVP